MQPDHSISGNSTREQAKDTGLALLLISFIYLYAFEGVKVLLWPGILLVLVMTVPSLFIWPAKIWLGFSRLLGAVMTRVLLTLLFFFVVCPVAFFRRLAGADAMRLKDWKKGAESVFRTRERTFVAADLENPY